jgi:hypothetical protein
MLAAWRQKADEMIPEQGKWARAADTPYLLWTELRTMLEQAYDSPHNESLIKRIYEFADWCDHQPRGRRADDDLLTAVAVCFYEHLPEHPAARADMPRWFTRQEVLNMKELLCYHNSEEDFEKLLTLFPQTPHQRKETPSQKSAKKPRRK